ncbi:hypothetical protein GCM10023168_20690 [Fodinibacter luteus]|uniref:Protein kinase domain-containing protein n=1 Tax=Fodinibacter luteus TaxID=552064 RepID=A0ABP8KFR3_9MICO
MDGDEGWVEVEADGRRGSAGRWDVADAAPPEVPGFELGELLARGGTSEVWAGVALDGGRRVAVKVVHAAAMAVEAAAREAALSAHAASAHVVPVEACIGLDDGRAALVMPHLRGGSLHGLVRARGHLSPGEVVTVLAPVASALGRLHELGVVHGDVSPGNVLLDLEGRPRLGDLGLGHVVGEVSPGVWGTDGYVAPEVVLGADPTAAADVYALGALGWLCLSGTVPGPPGLRPALAEVCRAGEGSEPVVRALDAALAPDPADRPGAHELAWQLFEAAEPEPLRLVRGDDDVSAVTYRLRAAAGRPPQRPAPHPLARWGAAARRLVPHRRVLAAREVRRGRGRHAAANAQPRWRRPARLPADRGLSVVPSVTWSVAAVALTALLVVAVAALGGDVGTAEALGGTTEARSSRGVGPGPVGASAVEPSPPAPGTGRTASGSVAGEAPDVARRDPRTDPTAPRSRPKQLLDVLAEARAAAWREATPELLHAADAPGSAAAAQDAAAVAELARAGLRYPGLRYTVVSAQTVSVADREAVVRARIDTGPYDVAGPSGRTPRPAAAGDPVLVELVHTDVGWRVRAIRPAD